MKNASIILQMVEIFKKPFLSSWGHVINFVNILLSNRQIILLFFFKILLDYLFKLR